ncbi:unnamed protein product [Tuber melanosporum]|uniref:(Perigord truffle) hypothetical protein n=1 Tax=Tuber melanosporum (strain Mel28) TaxID=656061 RepID=D5GD40_TUBMM|nr:uncharacterized protein GSTUM_00000956001 [Tuber melanosporum]CAZ82433.1 unnamed protein product [Tuber melanosporum]
MSYEFAVSQFSSYTILSILGSLNRLVWVRSLYQTQGHLGRFESRLVLSPPGSVHGGSLAEYGSWHIAPCGVCRACGTVGGLGIAVRTD